MICTSCPFRQHSRAATKPAGPAPTIRTDIPDDGCRLTLELLHGSIGLSDLLTSTKKDIVIVVSEYCLLMTSSSNGWVISCHLERQLNSDQRYIKYPY